MDVVIYARLSLDKLGNELGVDRQLEACRELAARQGWTVTRELIDNSISATTGRVRPAFEKLLTLSPKPEAIIVWHLDRLVRLTQEPGERGRPLHGGGAHRRSATCATLGPGRRPRGRQPGDAGWRL
ncbi:recombinase family protein [Micromonospora zamorensis]|uniref:recombinase family protein n=1 Tax=Micromonospora zamorensis TaxID=709883 RepID=UPI0037AADC26